MFAFSDSDYISPDDTWQYLYKLTPKMRVDDKSAVKVRLRTTKNYIFKSLFSRFQSCFQSMLF